MRFHGTLATNALEILLDITQSFTRLSSISSSTTSSSLNTSNGNLCAFTITPEIFAIAMKNTNDELQCFVQLQISRLFHDILIQSLADNHIAFLCDIRLFHQALLSGKDAGAIMLRLLKRGNGSFICLRMRAVDIDIVQSVPITVISMATVVQFCEPKVPPPEIILEMPPVKVLRTIVDKFRSLHTNITLDASTTGTLVLRMEANGLIIQSLFPNLRYRKDLLEQVEDEYVENLSNVEHVTTKLVSATLDTKMFSKAILIDSATTERVLCCLTENRAAVFHSILMDGYGSLTCYVPVLTPELI